MHPWLITYDSETRTCKIGKHVFTTLHISSSLVIPTLQPVFLVFIFLISISLSLIVLPCSHLWLDLVRLATTFDLEIKMTKQHACLGEELRKEFYQQSEIGMDDQGYVVPARRSCYVELLP